jgi:hypothetical protein
MRSRRHIALAVGILLTPALAVANPLGVSEVIAYAVADSPPIAPAGVAAHRVDAVPRNAALLLDVPTSSWTYGCSATAAGMLFGYYDRTGYDDMYTGPCNGGVAPLTNLGSQCSIIATQQGFDGRSRAGHVDDYWTGYLNQGPDPFEGNWAEHQWTDCTADFLGTNQWKWDVDGDQNRDFNVDGATTYFYNLGPDPLVDFIPPPEYGLPSTALTHGLRLFAESRGYNVVTNYTQRVDAVVDGGFSFDDYVAQIDAGRPVMIQVTGHTMLGVGYDTYNQTMYLHDTWGDYVAAMPWGGDYGGMAHQAMTVIELVPIPEPGTLLLVLLLVTVRRR